MNIATLEKNKSLIHLVDLNFQNLRDIQLHMPNSFKTFYLYYKRKPLPSGGG